MIPNGRRLDNNAVSLLLLELEIVLKKQSKKDGENTEIVENRQRMIENNRGEQNRDDLSSSHHEREDKSAELLNRDEYEYLPDSARHGQEKHVESDVRVLAEERERLAQLALKHETHKRVGRRVEVRKQHERHTRHVVVANEVILPRRRETIADQIAQQAQETRERRLDHFACLREVLLAQIAEHEYSHADYSHAQIFIAFVGLVRDDFTYKSNL